MVLQFGFLLVTPPPDFQVVVLNSVKSDYLTTMNHLVYLVLLEYEFYSVGNVDNQDFHEAVLVLGVDNALVHRVVFLLG